jgi:hypothetical protein
MAKLKLSAIPDDRPVKLTVELPGAVHRDLVAYAEVFAQEHGQKVEPAKLVPSMRTNKRCLASAKRQTPSRARRRAGLDGRRRNRSSSKTLVQKYLGRCGGYDGQLCPCTWSMAWRLVLSVHCE